jgi:hypothetical protein
MVCEEYKCNSARVGYKIFGAIVFEHTLDFLHKNYINMAPLGVYQLMKRDAQVFSEASCVFNLFLHGN